MGNDTHRWGPTPPVTFVCHLPALPKSVATEVLVPQDELLQLGGKDASKYASSAIYLATHFQRDLETQMKIN